MKKLPILLMTMFTLTACDKDIQLAFETQHIDQYTNAKIDINYPQAVGKEPIAKNINEVIEHTIATDMNITDPEEKKMSIKEAAAQFDQEFKKFKTDFQDSAQQWEVKVDGDVVFESANVISVVIDSYIDTGGAHGNSVVTYLNFNPQTGALLEENDLLKKPSEFKTIAEKAFKEQTKPKDTDETMEDFFFGEEFQLPANMGFSQEGFVLLYNNYEIASYAQGTTKIILPYEKIKDQLKVLP